MIVFWIILCIVVWLIGVRYMYDITDNLDKDDILYKYNISQKIQLASWLIK